jgi:hypothetical protein
VVKKGDAQRFKDALEARFGALEPREAPPPGLMNVNDTKYLDTGHVLGRVLGYAELPKEGISPKIRIRNYRLRKPGGEEHKAPITRGFSFFELKIPHPDLPHVSLKPRFIINNHQIPLLLERDQFEDERTRAALVEGLKADRRNDPDEVDQVIDLVAALHREHAIGVLHPRLGIRYVREAYRVPVPGVDGKPLDIQVTFDRDLEYRDAKGKKIGVAPRSWRTVEVKIPVDLADLDEAALEAKGLGDLAALRALEREHLETARVKPRTIAPGHGKSSLLGKLWPKEKAKAYRPKEWKRSGAGGANPSRGQARR